MPRADAGADADPTSALLQAIARRRQVLAAHLSEAQSLRLEGGELRIAQPPGDTWLTAALERPGNRAALEESLAEVCGPGHAWRIVTGAGAAPAPAGPPPTVAASTADPRVQAVLDIFGGTIAAVERGAPEE
jgi:hypothetical protein